MDAFGKTLLIFSAVVLGVIVVVFTIHGIVDVASGPVQEGTNTACWTASATVTPQMQVVELQGGVALWVTANANRVCVQPVGEGW